MREKDFVEQNKEKWKRFEDIASKSSNSNPDELDELYTKITNDLSYARTYYNRRSIRVYLNKLAQSIFSELYKYRKGRKNAFTSFWTELLPQSLYLARRELNISLIFFVFAMLLGILSSIHENDFAQLILGDRYVKMTEENIAKGQPMAVYDSGNNVDMFFAITWNNIKVAFLTYVLGAFFAIGSLLVLLYNGIMVGTFQYFFIERELFQESFLTIWMHGAFEISAIVIAGGAGLTLGRGLLFPGNLPRLQSFQISARRSIQIMLGLIPVFIAAGFIEGFFTRYTEAPETLRGAFIIFCFLAVAFYFWYYPWSKFRNHPPKINLNHLIDQGYKPVELQKLRSSKEVFGATFKVYRSIIGNLLLISVSIAFAYSAVFFALNSETLLEKAYLGNSFFPIGLFLKQFTAYGVFPNMFFPNVLAMTTVIWFCLKAIQNKFITTGKTKANWVLFIKTTVVVGIFELAIWSGYGLLIFLSVLAIPFLLFWLVTSFAENKSLLSSLQKVVELLRGSRRNLYVSFLGLSFVSFLLIGVVNMPISTLYLEGLLWNIDAEADTQMKIALMMALFVHKIGIFLVVPLFAISQLLEVYSAKEVTNADELWKQVRKIGVKESAYGMEKE